MNSNLKITFLGTGTSHGIPMIGCSCSVCNSTNPKNHRLRSSIFVQSKDTNILIDTSTEFRLQAVKHKIQRLDAVLYTHCHADHVHGIDDLRRYNEMQKTSIPCYGNAFTIESIKKNYSYVNSPKGEGGGIPQLEFIIIKEIFKIKNLEIIPVEIFHGSLEILGYRIGNMAYLTDCSKIPEESYKKLLNLDVLIIDGLRHRPHSTHFTLEQAVAEMEKIKPEKTFITHICHDLEHDKENSTLPSNCQLAYDGLIVETPKLGIST